MVSEFLLASVPVMVYDKLGQLLSVARLAAHWAAVTAAAAAGREQLTAGQVARCLAHHVHGQAREQLQHRNYSW